MISTQQKKDLVVLVADNKIESAVKGLLTRDRSLSIRNVTTSIYKHPEHDPGCLLRGHEFLRPFVNQYAHALVLLDHEGSGYEQESRIVLEKNIEEKLSQSGWNDRAVAVVIEPEIESWVWSNSPHLDEILGWKGKDPSLRDWLGKRGHLHEKQIKPDKPKKAMEESLRFVRKPMSASLYLHLAQKVGIERCIDESFLKLKNTLQQWFSL